VTVGTLLKSFPQGSIAAEKLLNVSIGRKRLERLTERIGAERIEARELETTAVEKLTLMEKIAGPPGVKPPTACAVSGDGGRLQKVNQHPDSKTHWFEYKAAICLELGNLHHADDPSLPEGDPCPEVPSFLLNFEQVETLTREIGQKAAAVPKTENDDDPVVGEGTNEPHDLEATLAAAAARLQRESSSPRNLPLSPRVKSRDVVATLGDCNELSRLLVARAWNLGMFQAERKGFIGDGGAWLWTIWEREFKPYDFVGILDIIHAVTHVFAGAMAGQPSQTGWLVYDRWIRWIWSGHVAKVIVALETRQQEVGLPTDEDGVTSPRKIVDATLTYLRNQQSRMDYPQYRRQGLPITSSHMESTIKELNFRIKGSEKFWGDDGGEEILHLKADTLCDSDPLTEFWNKRQQTRTGFHACTQSKT
jgi:hypothetical protein